MRHRLERARVRPPDFATLLRRALRSFSREDHEVFLDWTEKSLYTSDHRRFRIGKGRLPLTANDQGGDDWLDSDFDPDSFITPTFSFGGGLFDNIDAGFVEPIQN